MDCLRAISILLLAFFGFLSSPAYAQLNLKTGYNFSILSNPALDRLISDFNSSQSYTKTFGNLRWTHGFEAGLRGKVGMHALELTYQGANKALHATGSFPGTANEYTDKLSFSTQSGAIGYQAGNGFWGFGTDLQYQFYKVKYVDEEANTTFKNKQDMMAFKFYLMLTFSGNSDIDFVMQPYMVLPTKSYDLVPLSEMLKTEMDAGNDKWIRYGLTLLFYNGSK